MRKSHIPVMLLALLLVSTNASAQGFAVYEHSACTMARGGAAVAQPCDDGSGVFFNPAALALGPKLQISGGGVVISPRGSFTNFTTGTVGKLNENNFPVPSLYVSKQFGKFAIGGGLFAPYGLTTDWPTDFEGRFLGYKTSLKGIYVQPTVAYRVNDKFAIGGGIDITYASLELNQRVDLSTQYAIPPGVHPLYPAGLKFSQFPVLSGQLILPGMPAGTDFADVQLSGNAYKVGYHLGVQWKLNDNFSMGARYLSRERYNITNGVFRATQIKTNLSLGAPLGTLPALTPIDTIMAGQFSGSNSLADGQSAQTGIVYPDQFVIGVAIKARPHTTLFLDYQFTNWSLFDQIVITKQYPAAPAGANVITMEENYNNTHAIRFGIEHEMKQVILRGGFLAHNAASPDATVTPLLPEADRRQVTAGIGVKVSRFLRADFAYQYLMQIDRNGRTVPIPLGTPPTSTAFNNGTYAFKAHLFSMSMVVHF